MLVLEMAAAAAVEDAQLSQALAMSHALVEAGEEAGEEEEDSCWTTTMPTLPLLVLDPSSPSDPLTGGGTHPSIIFVVATLAFTR